MSDDVNFSDDVLFDRLVDGELTAGERRQLLSTLDVRPDGWRRCALAFLEAQAWKEGMQRMVQPEAVTPATIAVASPSGRIGARISRGRWLSIAASLLAAFTLGSLLSHGIFSNRGVLPGAGSEIVTVTQPPSAGTSGASSANDALSLWVRDDSGQMRPLRVPLVDANTLDRQLGLQFQTGVPEEMRSHLQRSGYDVQSKQRYAPFWFENGRPLVVPVEDTRIMPVSQKVY